MYTLIRIIILILIFPIIAFSLSKVFRLKYFSKKHNPEMYEKAKNNKKPVGRIIAWALSVVLVVLVIAIPLSMPCEGTFITFDSKEEALSYVGVDIESAIMYETDATIFVIEDNNIYSVTRKDNGFGVPNYKCNFASYYEPIANRSVLFGYPEACFNKETNESLYLVEVSADKELTEITLNSKDGVLIDSYTRAYNNNTYNYYRYVCVAEGPLHEEIELHTFGVRAYDTVLKRK